MTLFFIFLKKKLYFLLFYKKVYTYYYNNPLSMDLLVNEYPPIFYVRSPNNQSLTNFYCGSLITSDKDTKKD